MSSSATTLPPAREIPSTLAASARSWWLAGKSGAASEARLLRHLHPYFRPAATVPGSALQEDLPIIAQIEKVQLSRPDQYINTLSMRPTSPSSTKIPPTIILHGYGAGLGFFFKNFPALAHWAGRRGAAVYALDWLGMGRSARVPFAIKAKRSDIPARVHEAESFFVDSLEEWRARMGLESMTLVAHSLGAYLGAAYALRHPARVSKLVLLSPAGVPRDPTLPPAPPSPRNSTLSSSASSSSAEWADAPQPGDAAAESGTKKGSRRYYMRQSRGARLLTYLWEEGWSPFQIVRLSLFWAPMLVGKYSARRFVGLSEEDTRNLHDYIVHITLAKGSGEYCITHLLAPGIHARIPLVDRIDKLKMPVTFVYGSHDWMDVEGGNESVEKLRRAGNGRGRVYVVPRAGHHLYLDNPKAVNDLLIKELDRQL